MNIHASSPPFWLEADWHLRDPHLTALEAAPFQRPMPVLKPAMLRILRGPYQVGKTTLLKSLLKEGLDAQKTCFFLSCERVQSAEDLLPLLDSLRSYDWIALDAVSGLPGLGRVLRTFLDTGFRGQLIASGTAPDLEGLRLHAEVLQLLPMEFEEWAKMRKLAGWPVAGSRVSALTRYFVTGGLPGAVIEAGPNCDAPTQTCRAVMQGLASEVARVGRQEMLLKELLLQVALHQGQPDSARKLARRTGCMTHPTAVAYLKILEASGVIGSLPCLHPTLGAILANKGRKYFFRDPSFYWVASAHAVPNAQSRGESQARVAESVAYEYLTRRSSRLGFARSAEHVFFEPKAWVVDARWSPSAIPKPTSLRGTHQVWSPGNWVKKMPKAMTARA